MGREIRKRMTDQTVPSYRQSFDLLYPEDDPYSAYASVYDLQGQSRWSERMVTFLADLLPRYDATPRRVLDLACGTGTAAVLLTAQGYAVRGIDGSVQMLEMARQKAAEAGADVDFEQADMRAFTVPAPVDLVTCWFDSLNYL